MQDKSPISNPETKDNSPVPGPAVARATDEVLWCLIYHLADRGVIDTSALAGLVNERASAFKGNRKLETEADENEFAVSLALERVAKRLQEG
jgi:hypothetical protein